MKIKKVNNKKHKKDKWNRFYSVYRPIRSISMMIMGVFGLIVGGLQAVYLSELQGQITIISGILLIIMSIVLENDDRIEDLEDQQR